MFEGGEGGVKDRVGGRVLLLNGRCQCVMSMCGEV